jgi:hypothetical protein
MNREGDFLSRTQPPRKDDLENCRWGGRAETPCLLAAVMDKESLDRHERDFIFFLIFCVKISNDIYTISPVHESLSYTLSLPQGQDSVTVKRKGLSQALVAHAYKPRFSGGRDQQDRSSKLAWANS